MSSPRERLAAVRTRIRDAALRFGRDPDAITLLAVSKQQPPAAIAEVAEAGQRHFGENYLQEAQDKRAALARTDLIWHFIGPIQSNKTRAIAEDFDWVHSIDRLKIARRLSAQRPVQRPPLQICLQVNISGESSKSGVQPDQLAELAQAVAGLPRLRLRGLMAIPAPSDDFGEQRRACAWLRRCLEELREIQPALDTLSMGMSADLEAAIAE
ncbi:MAG: YggS family pyridoxal phosphate-dependent enzyme, partial [Candidatus Competibacterales bacterium]|nr:YggS family pyridoxal phosphate-dependent enzyme [Candidatus Competibacterales bacterium]